MISAANAMTNRSAACQIFLLTLTLPVQVGCSSQAVEPGSLLSISGRTMGTWYHVKVVRLPTGTSAAGLGAEIDQRLDSINQEMSTYLDDSRLSRFNRSPTHQWCDVSPDTARVVAAAQDVSRRTEGAFDVTVGPLVNLWNFGPNRQPERLPAQEEIRRTLARVGYEQLDVRPSPPALRKSRPDVYVDLSAIAKGFAVDAIAELLDAHAIEAYMVEIGGEVRAKGRKADGTAWRIGIERPVSGERTIQHVVELDDASLATSGDYRNFFEWEGRRYSHTIDPRTGRPVEHALASVSVMAGDCMTADAWATALMVLGADQALQAAQIHGLDVLLISRQAEGFHEQMTPGFAARISRRPPRGETR
jgi:thiamine biosynthesis lipoprotein